MRVRILGGLGSALMLLWFDSWNFYFYFAYFILFLKLGSDKEEGVVTVGV
jgi:hypothetical protein